MIWQGNDGIITDVTDGQLYRSLLSDGGFLSQSNNLTGTFNTDGVNLYSSSHIELWPIYLAINELEPCVRFSRENMVLVGIWQGKGKPPFRQYMTSFSHAMNDLLSKGISLEIGGETLTVKLAVICGTVALPAKAGILDMTQYNGSEACITCEEPGIVVKQGKGHARCYPYRSSNDQFPLRTSAMVKEAMLTATDKKRNKGFKGVSGLAVMDSLDLVKGIVPDYMHCLLLGIAKTMMNKWFSSVQSGEDYFIGKHLKKISKRLGCIKPPDFIERLPRDLEKHYSNFKATEIQAWLLFYGILCLNGILPDRLLEQFAQLSEATHILLQDRIEEEELQRAEELLQEFYRSFGEIYGPGSCGLNVHNAGLHMTWYVRQLGPLWAWNCFGFEDSNAMLLQSVHGTGCVMRQIMKLQQAQAILRRDHHGIHRKEQKWNKTTTAANCCIAGTPKRFCELDADILDNELDRHGLNKTALRKVTRVLRDGQKFYAEEYSRMQKRICHAVLLTGGRMGLVKYFVFTLDTKGVYAVVLLFQERPRTLQGARHLVCVVKSEIVQMVRMEDVLETLVYVNPGDSVEDNHDVAYVCRVLNKHGRSVFK